MNGSQAARGVDGPSAVAARLERCRLTAAQARATTIPNFVLPRSLMALFFSWMRSGFFSIE
ncbi:hypothetical protein [Ferrithrix thermotolerans]|uniref:hypothetical protein n=1 Tax=Ferrithrix thermotolerans TaxID=209649 RepID=UPI0011604062|nr:hypothetical protein [Ferrithrix thermotolerans]